MLVLNTNSPVLTPRAPKGVPVKYVPSSSRIIAFSVK